MPFNLLQRGGLLFRRLQLSILLLVLSSCNRTTTPADLQLTPRAGADPMNAVGMSFACG